MSLMTHADAVPWGESIRAELLAGHMPPWKVDGVPGRFRNTSALAPRELDVLLTWVTGGTPVGDAEKTPAPLAQERTWRLGNPDLVLQLPPVALPASLREDVREFTIPVGTQESRWLRAVDLLPGNPAIVRSATILVRPASSSDTSDSVNERVLGLWQPGDDPVGLEGGLAFRLPAAAMLTVRVHYKKTWRDEQRAMRDQSRIGVYFTAGPARELGSLTLAAPIDSRPSREGRLSFTQSVDQDLVAVAIYPDPALSGAKVRVDAVRPDGSHEQLIAFRPRSGWARRYWFTKPVHLPRGTRIEVVAEPDDSLLAPQAPRIPVASLDPARLRLTLDVHPGL